MINKFRRVIEYLGITILYLLGLNWFINFGDFYIFIMCGLVLTGLYIILFIDELKYIYYMIFLRILSAILHLIGD